MCSASAVPPLWEPQATQPSVQCTTVRLYVSNTSRRSLESTNSQRFINKTCVVFLLVIWSLGWFWTILKRSQQDQTGGYLCRKEKSFSRFNISISNVFGTLWTVYHWKEIEIRRILLQVYKNSLICIYHRLGEHSVSEFDFRNFQVFSASNARRRGSGSVSRRWDIQALWKGK